MDTDLLANMTIEQLLQRWPETVAVFQRRQMACPGCALAPFYTVADAASVYGAELQQFLAELLAAIDPPQDLS